MLLKVFAVAIACTVQLLLLLLKHDLQTVLGTGLLLWIVFGGHEHLETPACLRCPDALATPQLAEDTSGKVGDIHPATESIPKLMYNQQNPQVVDDQQPATVNVAPVDNLAFSPIVAALDDASHGVAVNRTIQTCSPIVAILDLAHRSPALRTAAQACSPIIALDIAPHSATTDTTFRSCTPIVTVLDLAPCSPVVATTTQNRSRIVVAAETILLDRVASSDKHTDDQVVLTKSDVSKHQDVTTRETAVPTTSVKINTKQRLTETTTEQLDVNPTVAHQKSATIRNDGVVQSTIFHDVETPIIVSDDSIEAAIEQLNIETALIGPMTIIEDSIDECLEAFLSPVIGISSSDQSTKLTTSDSAQNTHTPPSSDDGGIVIEDCSADSNEDSDEDDVDEVIPAVRPRVLMVFRGDGLARLPRVHQNPTFHEGPLCEVTNLAYHQRKTDVNSRYNLDDSESGLWELASTPDRPVADDAKDIDRMLQDIWQDLPVEYQQCIFHSGTYEVNRSRDGMTGVNFFIDRLELLWYQKYRPEVNGYTINVTDPSMVRAYEMARTRNYRPAIPRGVEPHVRFDSTHRQYLTDGQEVMVNEGCADHSEYNDHEVPSEKPQELEAHPGHAGTRSKNFVLGWLDIMEGFEFYDAHAYLPCICGRKAQHEHLKSRYSVESGYDPSLYGHAESQPTLLGEDALEEDLQRKAREDAHFARARGFPRSQTFAQDCPLHTIPTNNPWILMDRVDNPNDILVGANEGLPAPGFQFLTECPPGFRMPYGFMEVEHEALSPRCEHGLLRPPFVDACMACFPTGEHADDCTECHNHDVVKAIKQDPMNENKFEKACKAWDQKQLGHARRGEEHEKWGIECAQHRVLTWAHGGWPQLTDV